MQYIMENVNAYYLSGHPWELRQCPLNMGSALYRFHCRKVACQPGIFQKHLSVDGTELREKNSFEK